MTSKIESTKREMYRALKALKAGGRWLLKKGQAEAFEEAFEAHLDAQNALICSQRNAIADLYMTNRVLVRQVEALAREADLLKTANRAAGDHIRSAFDASFDRCIPPNTIMVVNGDKAHIFRAPE